MAVSVMHVRADSSDYSIYTVGVADHKPKQAVEPKIETEADLNAHSIAKEGSGDSATDNKNILEKQRLYIANKILDFTGKLDNFFSKKNQSDNTKNSSYLVLTTESSFKESGENKYNLRVQGKADLPNAKDRLKLIFESSPEEDLSLQDSERLGKSDNAALVPEQAIAGLEYNLKASKDQWRSTYGLGVRMHFPVDMYARIKVSKVVDLNENWRLSRRFELPIFAREGAKPSFRIRLSKQLSDSLVFTTSSKFKYTHEESLSEILQIMQINKTVGDRLTIGYKIGAFADNKPKEQVHTYFTQLSFKQNIYQGWLYLSLVPEISYERGGGWRPSYAFSLRLQAVYSE
ncbi:MAG: hypothetical protein ACI9Y1_003686 [Lentisphaeria bacterium]|jgi:hypothetical protein